jgi:hypothetical protein
MNKAELKAQRDAIEKDGIGVYLDVVKQLFAAIDEHVAEDENESATELQAKVTELEAQIAELEAQKAVLSTPR